MWLAKLLDERNVGYNLEVKSLELDELRKMHDHKKFHFLGSGYSYTTILPILSNRPFYLLR